jgi:hypothetical protein
MLFVITFQLQTTLFNYKNWLQTTNFLLLKTWLSKITSTWIQILLKDTLNVLLVIKFLHISFKPIVKAIVKVVEKFWTYLDVEGKYDGMVG